MGKELVKVRFQGIAPISKGTQVTLHVDNPYAITMVYSIVDHEHRISYVSEEPGRRRRRLAVPFVRARVEETVVHALQNTTELTVSDVRADSSPPRTARGRRPGP